MGSLLRKRSSQECVTVRLAVRAENVDPGLEDDGDQRHQHLRAIRAQVPQQALHQPAVIRFAQYIFFLNGGHGYETIVAKAALATMATLVRRAAVALR
jgi:hypothetical protein